MFTGIITHLAKVVFLNTSEERDCELCLDLIALPRRNLAIGCSICCMGACLTLTKTIKKHDRIELFFRVSQETINKTNIYLWQKDDIVNIEFSLRIQDELGGHIVLGHVDLVVKICDIRTEDGSKRIFIKIPEEYLKMIAPKGSVCLNGVSLTINSVVDDIFDVNIIEHTLLNTSFQTAKIGDLLNLEIDVISRYVSRIINQKT